MDELIIKDEDLLKPEHWPVEVALGLYGDKKPGFLNILSAVSEGTGYEFNDAGITFWSDLDDFEKENENPFDIECFVLDDDCQLTYKEFGFYVDLACKRFGLRNPDKSGEAEALANAYRELHDL